MIQQATNSPKQLNKDDILTTEARRIVFDCVMQGFNLKKAAEKAHLGHNYVKNFVTKSDFYPLVRQEKAIIEAKTYEKLEITREGQAKKYERVIEQGHELGQLSAVNGAVRGQNELCGLVSDKSGDMAKISLAAALTALVRSGASQEALQSGSEPRKRIEATIDPIDADTSSTGDSVDNSNNAQRIDDNEV